jgi:hypothetical protein
MIGEVPTAVASSCCLPQLVRVFPSRCGVGGTGCYIGQSLIIASKVWTSQDLVDT